MQFKNPIDNWDDVGFKLRTYENIGGNGGNTALVDKLERDVLVPLLRCDAPCNTCWEDGTDTYLSVGDDGPEFSNGLITIEKYDRDYCTSCWIGNPNAEPPEPARPQKYLMTKVPWKDGEGDSTCLTRCENGWTSNGGVNSDWVCVRCNPRCETCEDQGQIGDLDKCLECSTFWPFLYPEKQTCFQKCDRFPLEKPNVGEDNYPQVGLYQVDSDTCGRCDDSCLRCQDDKFNCTKCDNSPDFQLALF